MKTFRITWHLFKEYDPEQEKHYGPKLMLVDPYLLRIRPYTREEAELLCKNVNGFAKRGHHKVEEFKEELDNDQI